jgi:hypothetical protein
MKKANKKMAIAAESGGWKLRIFHRRGVGKQSPRFLVKCGCCESSVKIYYGDEILEINGVCASLGEWRQLLLPLLGK